MDNLESTPCERDVLNTKYENETRFSLTDLLKSFKNIEDGSASTCLYKYKRSGIRKTNVGRTTINRCEEHLNARS